MRKLIFWGVIIIVNSKSPILKKVSKPYFVFRIDELTTQISSIQKDFKFKEESSDKVR